MGSSSIKIGFANEKLPFTIKPYVAYKRSKINEMEEEEKNG